MIVKSLQTAAKKMMIDFEELTSTISHMGERGTSREELLVEHLKKYLPEKYKLGRGIILDSNGNQSKQQDVILFDSFSSPVLMNLESTKMIPVESVYAVIEVKSSLNKTELEKSVNNIKSVRSLPKNPITPFTSPTAGFLFSYTSDTSLEALLGNFVEFNKSVHFSQQISMICVLDKGLIMHLSTQGLREIILVPALFSTPTMTENSLDKNFLLFYLFLMQYLNAIRVSPPNLFRYADSEKMLKFQHFIPKKHIPKGSFFDVDGNKVSIDNVMSLVDDMERFKVIMSGQATPTQIMEYFSDNLRKIYDLAQSVTGTTQSVINFFGKGYDFKKLVEVSENYKRIQEGEELSSELIAECKAVKEDLYNIYKEGYFKG